MNNRPLTYQEEDVQLPVLTPSSFLFQQPQAMPEMQPHQTEDKDLRKRLKFLRTTKDALWCRWSREYLTALRERHRITGGTGGPGEGDIVIIKGDEKNRNAWKMGKVTKLLTGKDGVVRGAHLLTGNGNVLERAIQHLYPLELSCDVNPARPLNPNVPEFRPRRMAAERACKEISRMAKEDNEEQ